MADEPTPDTLPAPQGEGGGTYGDTTADAVARRSKFRKPQTEIDPSAPLTGEGEASPID
jgi:hypothetical protein